MKSLLIVVDMQKDFIDGPLGTKEAQAVLPNVIKKIKNHTGDIIYTRDTHEENYLSTQEGRKLPVRHCIAGTRGWQLEDEIKELAEEKQSIILDKPTFGSLELARLLKSSISESKWNKIEMVGVCTDICILSNAIIIKTALPEVPLIVDSSCCAGVTPDSHSNALEAMKMCQIDVVK